MRSDASNQFIRLVSLSAYRSDLLCRRVRVGTECLGGTVIRGGGLSIAETSRREFVYRQPGHAGFDLCTGTERANL